MIASPQQVLSFWREAGPKQWFGKSAEFDSRIEANFLATYKAAAAGALSEWERTAEDALALLIVLDQFPRNMFRDSAEAFAADPLARQVADRALAKSFDQDVPPDLRPFFYLPFEHSEEMADQDRCLALCRATGDAESLKWAQVHADIIAKFGRFPHRNAALGRSTTQEEQAFLDAGGFKG